MSEPLSPNTQAILLLTAPLLLKSGQGSSELLTPGEYKRLAACLRDLGREPAELLSPGAAEILEECRLTVAPERAARLLARGFLLSQVFERWQARAIWVTGHLDAEYPRRLRERLHEDVPPVLYGCGEPAVLDTGGLAVVGSRKTGEDLISYAERVGELAAGAGVTLISGGARGIDQAAMRGAIAAGGKAVGVLAESLERTAMDREHRNLLLDGGLVLVSPYDPSVGFNVGHAMQRNKLIYALADAALVVDSDLQQGGTWAGAVEQLGRLRFVSVFVRSTGEIGPGLRALESKGARPWPNPEDSDSLSQVLSAEPCPTETQLPLLASASEPTSVEYGPTETGQRGGTQEPFEKARELLARMQAPRTQAEVADYLKVSRAQAKEWLQRLVDEGVLQKSGRPVRYSAFPAGQRDLFGEQE